MTLAWLWEDQIRALDRDRERAWQWFKESQAHIASGQPIEYDKAYTAYSDYFRNMAIAAHALDGDLRQCMVYLHVSAEFGERLLTLDGGTGWHFVDLSGIGTKRDDEGNRIPVDPARERRIQEATELYVKTLDGEAVRHGDRVGVSYFSDGLEGAYAAIEAISSALASGDMPSVERIAALPSRDSDFGIYPEETIWYARLLRCCVLGDMAEAPDHLDRLLKAPPVGGWPQFRQLGSLCYAIFRGDQEGAELHLRLYLKWLHKVAKPRWKQWSKDGPRYWLVRDNEMLLSVAGLAMCRFAGARGLPLGVDDKYLPRSLLSEPPVLESYADTFIEKALAEGLGKQGRAEPKKSLLSRLLRGKQE